MKEKSLGQKTSPYDLYSYNNIPTNSLPHDIRLRPGNVIFNHNLEWLNDNMGSRVDYSAPGHGCTTMLYNVDGSRLFSWRTNADGGLQIFPWLRFNKEGNLLVVATADNGIKILANAFGLSTGHKKEIILQKGLIWVLLKLGFLEKGIMWKQKHNNKK
ncbi:unnamed protein product [Lactuca virosa]|uniref:Strictosidine synthase conserved region domain-containing protein n=1 Tax=Lactuca virosa TaxID=75947 RepID=A0AAU9PE29_9ASTR|nr:unnamed protein product [Lactuca virosa]